MFVEKRRPLKIRGNIGVLSSASAGREFALDGKLDLAWTFIFLVA
jgi:hypothetical protein